MQTTDLAFERTVSFQKQFVETRRLQKQYAQTVRLHASREGARSEGYSDLFCPSCYGPVGDVQLQVLEAVTCGHCGVEFRAFEQFGRFQLQSLLGAGGMGAVYQAVDLQFGRAVALKILRDEFQQDRELAEMIEYEARITAAISNPHIVRVYATGTDHGLYYIAMELLDGGTLADVLAQRGAVTEQEGLSLVIQIAQGLREAHRHGLLHRDIKPANVLLSRDGAVKIADFGLSVPWTETGEEQSDLLWGSPWYISPETVQGVTADIRSDIYCLGATLYHLLAGRPPFLAETAWATALKRVGKPPVSIRAFAPSISNPTVAILSKMLHPNPADRYGFYEHLIQDLEIASQRLARTPMMPKAAAPRAVQVVQENETRMSGIFALTTIILAAAVIVFAAVRYWLWSR